MEVDHEASLDRPRAAGDHWCGLCGLSVLLTNRRSQGEARIKSEPFYFSLGHSHTATTIAISIPANCARRKAGTPEGAIPAKVSERERAMVTAGFANDVDAVNQYADVM